MRFSGIVSRVSLSIKILPSATGDLNELRGLAFRSDNIVAGFQLIQRAVDSTSMWRIVKRPGQFETDGILADGDLDLIQQLKDGVSGFIHPCTPHSPRHCRDISAPSLNCIGSFREWNID